jgi:hypothetical protein
MSYSQADLEALKAAIISGVKKVKINNRETEFRDLSEMKQILNDAELEVSGRTRRPYFSCRYDRGYQ